MWILPILAMASLSGCEGAADWLRGPPAATAYAAPLASDTTVVTTRRIWSSSGSNTDSQVWLGGGEMMPNGAAIALTDWNSGDPGVFNLATREFRRFRFNDEPWDSGFSNASVPSPDGSRVLVEWSDFEPEQSRLLILDVATEESQLIMLPDSMTGNSFWPVQWTLEGDSVFAFSSPLGERVGDRDLILLPIMGGTPRRVHTFRHGAWPGRMVLSPDGRWLVYTHRLWRNQESWSDIYIVDVQSGGARPLVEHPGVDLLVGWLPGTDVVLFSSDRSGATDLWSVRVVNGRASAEPRLVRSDFHRSEAVGFGDGALFYTVRTGSRGPAVVSIDPQSGALYGAPSPPLEVLDGVYSGLAWSPDGETLAAITTQGGRRTITLLSLETGESRVFLPGEDVRVTVIRWTADGKAILLRASEGNRPADVHHFLRLDLITGTTTRLFASAEPEDWGPHLFAFHLTPDGRSLLLRHQRTLDDDRTEMKLVLRSLEDGSERELHRSSGYIPDLSISADGTLLAFMEQVWGNSDSLFVMKLDGSHALQAVAGWSYDEVSLLGWLPAGRSLLAARLSDDGTREVILRIELDGSTTEVGVSPFSPQRGARVPGGRRSRLLLSPGANWLAHNVIDTGGELWRMDGLPELFAHGPPGRR